MPERTFTVTFRAHTEAKLPTLGGVVGILEDARSAGFNNEGIDCEYEVVQISAPRGNAFRAWSEGSRG